jgi:hypothetical protein
VVGIEVQDLLHVLMSQAEIALREARPVLSTACILLRSCLMKDAVAANRLAGSMEDVVRAATRFLTEMTTVQPVFLPIAA